MVHFCLGLSISPRQWHLLSLHKIQISLIQKKKKNYIQKSTESVQENNEHLFIPPSAENTEIVASEISEKPGEEVASKNDEHSVKETSAVDEPPATYINPWDGPPAKEPVYPPGTYRGMF